MTDYDDYKTSVHFEGEYNGEQIITKARIHANGDIHIHQGPKTVDNEFRPDDIVGLPLEQMKKVVEKADKVVSD